MAAESAQPDPERAALAISMFAPSSLDAVASAISAATEYERVVYVERVEGGWRWSLVHPGGAYPLLRVAARFLQMDHNHLRVHCQGHESGMTILTRPGEMRDKPIAWRLLRFKGSAAASAVRRRITRAIPG